MVKIVESRKGNLTALRNLFLKGRQTTFSWADTSSFSLLDFDKETEREYILIALSDNTVIGFISVCLEDNFIHHLFIDEKHHSKGIGTKLLKAIVDKINFPVRLKCLENNTKGVNFYKKKGFIEKEKGVSEQGTYILFELSEKIR